MMSVALGTAVASSAAPSPPSSARRESMPVKAFASFFASEAILSLSSAKYDGGRSRTL